LTSSEAGPQRERGKCDKRQSKGDEALSSVALLCIGHDRDPQGSGAPQFQGPSPELLGLSVKVEGAKRFVRLFLRGSGGVLSPNGVLFGVLLGPSEPELDQWFRRAPRRETRS